MHQILITMLVLILVKQGNFVFSLDDLLNSPCEISPFCECFSVLFEPASPLCLTNTGSVAFFILHLFGV